MNARAGALPNDQVDSIIFHSRVKNLFDRGKQAMNLVEEQNFA